MIFNMVGGTSSPFNFKIVGGTTKPISPSENTIWINTDAEITSWAFDYNEPSEHTRGMVWIKTAEEGNVRINALKKNAIYICLVCCYQYDGSKWVTYDSHIFSDNKWTQIAVSIVYLIKDGVIDFEKHTVVVTPENNAMPEITTYEGYPVVSVGAGNGWIVSTTFENVKVPIGAKKVHVQRQAMAAYDFTPYFELGDSNRVTLNNIAYVDGNDSKLVAGKVTLDCSGLSGQTVYFRIVNQGSAGMGFSYIRNVWFEM